MLTYGLLWCPQIGSGGPQRSAVKLVANGNKLIENEALLQQRVLERTEALENKNKELEQFTYAASHDLQEPLRKIAMFSQRLEEGYSAQLDDAAKNFLSKVVTSARRMKSIIDGLLEYSLQPERLMNLSSWI